MLNLTRESVRSRLRIAVGQLVDDDPSIPRQIGVLARGLHLQGVKAPSATGVGDVLAVFTENLDGSVVEVTASADWTSMEDVRA